MGRVEGTSSMLRLNEEAGWTLFQFSAVDLSVWAGCFVPPRLRQRKGRQHSPSKGSRLTRKAETQRANRAVSETHQSLRSSPLSSQPSPVRSSRRQRGKARAWSQVQLSRLSGPQGCPSSIHLFSNARRLAQSEPGAHQSLVTCRIEAAACTRRQGKALP